MNNTVSLYAEILNEDERQTFRLDITADNLVADIKDMIREKPTCIAGDLVEYGGDTFQQVAKKYKKLCERAGNYNPYYVTYLPDQYRDQQIQLMQRAQKLVERLPIETLCLLYNVLEWDDPDALQWYILLDDGERVPIDTTQSK